MNIVEAIDAWIDVCIDEMSDDELASILDVLDVVAASEYADVDVENLYDSDFQAMVDMVAPKHQRLADNVLDETMAYVSNDNAYEPPTSREFDEEPLERDAEITDDEDDVEEPSGEIEASEDTSDEPQSAVDDVAPQPTIVIPRVDELPRVAAPDPRDADEDRNDDDRDISAQLLQAALGIARSRHEHPDADEPGDTVADQDAFDDAAVVVLDEHGSDEVDDQEDDDLANEDDEQRDLTDEQGNEADLTDEQGDEADLADKDVDGDESDVEDDDNQAEEVVDHEEDTDTDDNTVDEHDTEVDTVDEHHADDDEEDEREELDADEEDERQELDADDDQAEDLADEHDADEEEDLEQEDLADEHDADEEEDERQELDAEHDAEEEEEEEDLEQEDLADEHHDEQEDQDDADDEARTDRDARFLEEVEGATSTNDGNLEDNDLEDNDLDDDEIVVLGAGEDDPGEELPLLAPAADAREEIAPVATAASAAPTPTVPLREFDSLGPSFLPDPPAVPKKRKGRTLARAGVTAFFIGGLAIFFFGMVQLINSLDSGDETVTDTAAAEEAEPTTTEAAPAATSTAEPEPEPTSSNAAADDGPEPTPTPVPEPPARIGIRLVNGDVMMATFENDTDPPSFVRVYEPDGETLASANFINWIDDQLGVVDVNGNVHLVVPDGTSEPTTIYDAGEEFSGVEAIVSVPNQVAIRTANGDIALISRRRNFNPNSVQTIWDASEEGLVATDLSSSGALVVFTIESGDAKIANVADDELIDAWTAGDQPPAYNVVASERDVLFGVGAGAIARFQLGDVDGVRVSSAWDPIEDEEVPAIGYGPAGDRTVVVLADGGLVLADDTRNGPRIWDQAETELRALAVSTTEREIIVLLETGSVLRIPVDAPQQIQSIWDITDETLVAANQVLVEPAWAN